jgi:AraC family transcriptional regulator
LPSTERLPDVLRRRLVDYIESHLGADLRIASLASVCGLSGPHFNRVFRHTFCMTPHRYVTQRRLAAARSMLATGQSLATIAYAVGFSSQGHFTQAYRRRYGETPGRSRHRASDGTDRPHSFLT